MNSLQFLIKPDRSYNRPFRQYPHENDGVECKLINTIMYQDNLGDIRELYFVDIFSDFLGSVNSQGEQNDSKRVEVSKERKCRSEEMPENEFEELKKKLAKKCFNKEKCGNCYIEKGDCPLLHGWKKEGVVYKHSYPILGEYLPDLKKVVLYKDNIDDVCGKPTYNGVLSTYIHELFHAYFHYFTEQKKATHNYIREVEEAMTEFSTLVFLRVMEKMMVMNGQKFMIGQRNLLEKSKKLQVTSLPTALDVIFLTTFQKTKLVTGLTNMLKGSDI